METITAHLVGQTIFSNDSQAFSLYEKSALGEKVGEKVQYALPEALYLAEKKKIQVLVKGKGLTTHQLLEKLQKIDKQIQVKTRVFQDLREKGYIVKTALKFGAAFRVYNKHSKIGEQHARWLVYPVWESETVKWHEFAAKSRVAHSTKKQVLIAIVDEESDVSYYEVDWKKI